MSKDSELTKAQAHAVYDVLEAACGARPTGRDHFVYDQTHRHLSEWRFMGKLGFGGKFWRTTGRRADESWGEVWRVDQYPEDATDESRAMIADANERLATLQQSLTDA